MAKENFLSGMNYLLSKDFTFFLEKASKADAHILMELIKQGKRKINHLERILNSSPVNHLGAWMTPEEISKLPIGRTQEDVLKLILSFPAGQFPRSPAYPADTDPSKMKYGISTENIEYLDRTGVSLAWRVNTAQYNLISTILTSLNQTLINSSQNPKLPAFPANNNHPPERIDGEKLIPYSGGKGYLMNYAAILNRSRWQKSSLQVSISKNRADITKETRDGERLFLVTPDNLKYFGLDSFPQSSTAA